MIRVLTILLLAVATYAQRSSDGLLVLYTFVGDDNQITDRSGFGEPLNLRITNPANVRRETGSLVIAGKTSIESANSADKVIQAVKASQAFSAEVWLRAANTRQEGPARVISISQDTSNRNFTLGQEENAWDVRFRSRKSDKNGMPSLSGGRNSANTELAHLVYTRGQNGRGILYKDGRQIATHNRDGAVDNWDAGHHLMLANERTGDRPWEGEFFLVALFDGALTAEQVAQHFQAGPGAKVPPRKVTAQTAPTPEPDPTPQPQVEPKPDPVVEPAVSASGAIAFYDFNGDGPVVKDSSGHGNDLRIATMDAVRRGQSKLEIRGSAPIHGKLPKLTATLRQSRAISIEAWLQPADIKQEGPARIVTLSRDTVNRNFTLGQQGNKIDVRLRTPQTSDNGIPSLSAGGFSTKLTHVVYTRDRQGRTRIFLDGKKRAEGKTTGDFSNWDANYELALGNELSGDRAWKGTLHMVAIYPRALSEGEVESHFAAGANVQAEPSPELARRLFVQHVAPIFANHCLECHDPSTNKGDLDLSRWEPTLAGGESGPAIVPGKHKESLLWEVVASDDMPKKRKPLNSEEKALLRQWLDAGGDYALPVIDAAAYLHGSQSRERWVQRLTVNEYIATVQAALGVDIADAARRILPKDLRADGFSNTAYNLNVDFKHVDAYAQLASKIVNRMDLDAFLAEFATIDAIGAWLLRAPLERRERDAYLGITDAVERTGGDKPEQLRFVVEAMLQSPRFIYRMENQQAGGISAYELASRLSYVIWGAPPDRALFAAAKAGRLNREAAISTQVRRMLNDPRAVGRSLEFVSDWLNLGRLASMQPNRQHFPNWRPKLAADMRAETLAFFEDVVWKQKRPLSELLSAPGRHASPELARHYGPKPRAGLLMQGSVLTVGGDEASMVTRGLFVMHELLRGVVKDPPPCVDTTPIPSKPGKTQRAIALERINDRSCGGCHAKFEPLAFGLEKFDGLGSYHDKDHHGNTLRDDGDILVPGQARPRRYDNAEELIHMLAASPRVKESVTWKVAQFALGRPLGAADVPAINALHGEAQQNGGTYPALIRAICTSELIRK